MRFLSSSIGFLATLLLAGCGTHQQSATNSAGPQAALAEHLWWITFFTLLAIFVIVVGFLLGSVRRGRRGTFETPEREVIDDHQDRRMSRMIIVLVVLVVLFEFGFLVASVTGQRRIHRGLESKNPVEIQVIGHRFWWEFRYSSSVPSQIVTTANELHLPVGIPILIKTSSQDVIHSFWAPNLAPKRDLIPGYQTSFWIKADKEGAWRGQCAEFCGHQHAHMAFYAISEGPAAFDRWLEAQRKQASEPAEATAQHGRDLFMMLPCVTCHTIRGTDAGGRVGPELTHLASRSHIAAGTLPNTRENLARWITDAQGVKPGNQMPNIKLEPDQVNAIVTYLQTLK